jgi:hypothetical protein
MSSAARTLADRMSWAAPIPHRLTSSAAQTPAVRANWAGQTPAVQANWAAQTQAEKTSLAAQIQDSEGRRSSGLAAERQGENFLGGKERPGAVLGVECLLAHGGAETLAVAVA